MIEVENSCCFREVYIFVGKGKFIFSKKRFIEYFLFCSGRGVGIKRILI